MKYPTQARLRELFDYDSVSGDLLWRQTLSNRALKGSIAGCVDDKDHICVQVMGRSYRAHRLIWIYHHGHIPDKMQIDHIDRNRSNNRIDNLRLCTSSQNSANRTAKSSTGFKGVRRNGKRYQAVLKHDGKFKTLGTYDTPEEAHEVYLGAAKEIWGEFACSG